MKLSQAERALIVQLSDRGFVSAQYKAAFEFEEQLNRTARDMTAREEAIAARERAVAGVPEPETAARLEKLETQRKALAEREHNVSVFEMERREQLVTTEQARLWAWEEDLYSRERLYDGHQQRLLAEQRMVRIKEKLLGMTTSEEE